jgi:CheY-like chemotaxis protein
MAKQITSDGTHDDSQTVVRGSDRATVLLAEDDDAFRETERLWLAREQRWDTREAADGEEALATLDTTVDLLVLDQHMPNVSGPEVVARLSETEFDGAVVVVTASRPDDRLDVDDVDAMLRKPVDREEFIDALDRHTR